MNTNNRSKIHVLVMRDEFSVGDLDLAAPEYRIEDMLQEPRLRVTVAKAAYGEAARAARQHDADLIVLDGVFGDPVVLIAELDEQFPTIPLLVILDEAERERAHDCVVAGARSCLIRPIDPNTLVRTIVQFHVKSLRQRAQQQLATQQGARIIAVRGAKGGVGCTVVAANLAVAIKQASGGRVLLLDAHFFGGDTTVALDLVPTGSVANLIPHLHHLDDDLLDATLARHASGIDVLAAPSELERAEFIAPEEFQRVLETLRPRYDVIVLDTSPFLDLNSLIALDMAELLLLVATPQISALRNAARFLHLGAKFGYSTSKMRLVLNRANYPGGIDRADLAKHLPYAVSYAIPNDPGAVDRSMKSGEPIVTMERSSRVSRALRALAKTVMSNEEWGALPSADSGRRPKRLGSMWPFARGAGAS